MKEVHAPWRAITASKQACSKELDALGPRLTSASRSRSGATPEKLVNRLQLRLDPWQTWQRKHLQLEAPRPDPTEEGRFVIVRNPLRERRRCAGRITRRARLPKPRASPPTA